MRTPRPFENTRRARNDRPRFFLYLRGIARKYGQARVALKACVHKTVIDARRYRGRGADIGAIPSRPIEESRPAAEELLRAGDNNSPASRN